MFNMTSRSFADAVWLHTFREKAISEELSARQCLVWECVPNTDNDFSNDAYSNTAAVSRAELLSNIPPLVVMSTATTTTPSRNPFRSNPPTPGEYFKHRGSTVSDDDHVR
jgi:hypothetical protein